MTTSTRQTTARAIDPQAPALPAAMPGLLRASRARSGVELKSFFRNKQSLIFTLLFPIILLLVFGAIFDGKVKGTNTDFKLVFMSGIIAAGILSTAFSGLAISIVIERDTGTIRRLASTPMPKAAYFIGKLVRVLLTTILETVLLIGIAVTVYGLKLPSTSARWGNLIWIVLLGSVACGLLGIAYTALIPDSRSATPIVIPVYMVLQFISGVFFPFNELPRWMQSVAALFPVKWMTQGFRSVFLPDSFTAVEPAHSWEITRIALVLGAWAAAGAVLAGLTFRWRGPRVK